MTNTLDWQLKAACRGMDTETFYPKPGAEGYQRLIVAKGVCAVCPVQSQCLEYALENREGFGIWGGKTEAERREIVRKRTRRNSNGQSKGRMRSVPNTNTRGSSVADIRAGGAG